MELRIDIPDIESIPFIKMDEDKPILISNNSSGKTYRITNLKIPKEEGIYFLYDREYCLLYIGQSENLLSRISTHRGKDDFFYVKFFITNFTKRVRIAVEQLLIDKYKPKNQLFTTQNVRAYT